MIEVTEADRQVAESIMATCQGDYGQEVWITDGHNAGISLRQEIALALATAREAARPPKGCVMDDEGRVLTVNGTLPVTKDGVVWIDRDKPLYTTLVRCGFLADEEYLIPMRVECGPDDHPTESGFRDLRVDECYSTREAALAAKEARNG